MFALADCRPTIMKLLCVKIRSYGALQPTTCTACLRMPPCYMKATTQTALFNGKVHCNHVDFNCILCDAV